RQTGISDVVGELVSNQGQQTQSCSRRRDRIWTLVCAVQCGDQQCGRDLAADFASAVRVCVNIGVTSAASDGGDLVGCQRRQIDCSRQGSECICAQRLQQNDRVSHRGT